MTKLTEEHQRIADKMSMIQVAVNERQLSNLNNLHSQVASGGYSNPCHVNDLEPGSCPPGVLKLVALKKTAEDGRAQCIQTAMAARDRLTQLKMEADQIDVDVLRSSLCQHGRQELDRLEKEKVLCAQVAGTPHDIKGIDEILKDEEISLALPEAAKAEKYEEVKWQRIQRFCSLGPEVANALISQGKLRMNLDEIFGVLKQCQGVHQIGEQASQSKKEGEEILKKLKTHSDAELIFKIDFLLYLYFFQVLVTSDEICFISVIWLRAKDSVIDLLTECKKRRKEANTRVTKNMAQANKALEALLLGSRHRPFFSFCFGCFQGRTALPGIEVVCFHTQSATLWESSVALFRHLEPKFWDTALTRKESSICGSRISSFLLPFVLNPIAASAFPLRTRALATCFDDLVEAEVPENRGVKHPKPITHVERTLLVLTGKVHFSNPSPLNIHDLMYLSYRHTDLSFVATVQPGSVDARDGAESMSRLRCG